MAKILVVYYSRSGNTKKMAEMIGRGAQKAGASCDVKEVEDVKAEDLKNYDGIIMGSPTYYGSMAAELKKLIDESVTLHGSLEGKAGGAFSSSANIGGGNETTVTDILKAMLVHGMVVQGNRTGDHYGVVSIGSPDERVVKQCIKEGKQLALLAEKLHGG